MASSLFNRLLLYLQSTMWGQSIQAQLYNQQAIQKLLFIEYSRALREKRRYSFRDVGFRVYSQTDEDGILLYLFSVIGMGNRTLVELGSGSPFGANSTNLIVNWGWNGILVDGNPTLVQQAQRFYKHHKDTWISPPKTINAWITAENVNSLVGDALGARDVDFLSIDLDGVDYWIWKALEIMPRVVMVEYQDIWDAHEAYTVPYSDHFICPDPDYLYCGASLAAFTKLAQQRGYRLVGFNKNYFNAIFLRNDILPGHFPAVDVKEGLCDPGRNIGLDKKLARAKGKPWVEV